jgi:hypothetical protein
MKKMMLEICHKKKCRGAYPTKKSIDIPSNPASKKSLSIRVHTPKKKVLISPLKIIHIHLKIIISNEQIDP